MVLFSRKRAPKLKNIQATILYDEMSVYALSFFLIVQWLKFLAGIASAHI